MKKFYCFYCQKDVEPQKFLLWRICPECGHYMKDKGKGFYRVCKYCGANMPVDAIKCYKCGQNAELPDKDIIAQGFNKMSFFLLGLEIVFYAAILIALLGIFIYFSFYIICAVLIFCLICFIFNFFSPQQRDF